MCERTCKTCAFWGPDCFFYRDELRAYALCQDVARKENKSGYSAQDDSCGAWEQRDGEPLGTGVCWLWYFPCWLEPASIIHDLRYEKMPFGMSTVTRDLEWRRNAHALAGKTRWKHTVAEVGYRVIRLYSYLRGA